MKNDAPSPVYRRDYRPPDHWIDAVDLDFDLREAVTTVTATIRGRRNAAVNDGGAPLVLAGGKLVLCSVSLDGRPLGTNECEAGEERLVVPGVPDSFTLTTVVEIRPQDNTALSGLYRSNGNYCTQCEAEGFRRITYFLDRPDVMARYTTRIEADAARCPVLLSNGNRVASGELAGGRHWVRWEDPFPKPSYLFALVAGDLRCLEGQFTTRSGRRVRLEIWAEPANVDSCAHALASLKNAMRWDEEVFGLEYDLDVYMIVAVGDFNMGAMENKGLNIFNAKYVLARPETATDDDYERIGGVIAHEYFHNWTGNRVTCRDWFQLTLKEGLTVFRDQQFTADTTSPPVKRIADVRNLRTVQFAEAAGPMAHPIRPESYVEMNNFYTATVYEKGAEVIRLYHTLLGAGGFRKGMDLYFARHDGHAVTCDDFRAAMADANGVDLTQFERWYDQAGTPTVRARGTWNEAVRTYTLTLSQTAKAMRGEGEPRPFPIPVRVGLLGPDGADLPLRLAGEPRTGGTTRVLELTEAERTFTFAGIPARPVPSLLRGFSAPVVLEAERGSEELAFLMAHDSDPCQRWDAGQELGRRLLLDLVARRAAGRPLAVDPLFVAAFGRILADGALDGSLKSLALVLPAERELALGMEVVDPDGIHAVRQFVRRELARSLRAEFTAVYSATASTKPYANDKASIDRRRLHNCVLAYLATLDEDATTALVWRQFEAADNMTEAEAALSILADLDRPERTAALDAFYARWKRDPLVVDKWFTVQALSTHPAAVDHVLALARHPDFTWKNPNRVRSLVGAFGASNQVRFHSADGRGYVFVADAVLELDPLNPQVASRMVSAFNPWRRFDAGRQARMRAQLERIAARPGLSRDVGEIVARAREG
ncbi:MAG: aminopeptidase N [Planctomycetota bacterium]